MAKRMETEGVKASRLWILLVFSVFLFALEAKLGGYQAAGDRNVVAAKLPPEARTLRDALPVVKPVLFLGGNLKDGCAALAVGLLLELCGLAGVVLPVLDGLAVTYARDPRRRGFVGIAASFRPPPAVHAHA